MFIHRCLLGPHLSKGTLDKNSNLLPSSWGSASYSLLLGLVSLEHDRLYRAEGNTAPDDELMLMCHWRWCFSQPHILPCDVPPQTSFVYWANSSQGSKAH